MELTKEGRPLKKHEATCPWCGAEFAYCNRDGFLSYRGDTAFLTVACPWCGASLEVDLDRPASVE